MLPCVHMRETVRGQQDPIIELNRCGHDEQLYAELLFEDLAGGRPDERIFHEEPKMANGDTAEYDRPFVIDFLIERFLLRAGWSITEVFEHDRRLGTEKRPEGIFEVYLEKLVRNPHPEWGGRELVPDPSQGLVIRFQYAIYHEESALIFSPSDVKMEDSPEAADSLRRQQRFVEPPEEISTAFNHAYVYRISPETVERTRQEAEAERREKDEKKQALERIAQKATDYLATHGERWRMTEDECYQDPDLRRIVFWQGKAQEMSVGLHRSDPSEDWVLELVFYSKHGDVEDIAHYPIR